MVSLNAEHQQEVSGIVKPGHHAVTVDDMSLQVGCTKIAGSDILLGIEHLMQRERVFRVQASVINDIKCGIHLRAMLRLFV